MFGLEAAMLAAKSAQAASVVDAVEVKAPLLTASPTLIKMPGLVETRELHVRRMIGQALLGKPVQHEQTLEFINQEPGLKEFQEKLAGWIAADDELRADTGETAEMADTILHDLTSTDLSEVLEDALRGQAANLDESFLDRVKNAWRAFRGKKKKNKHHDKSKKHATDEEDASTASLAAGLVRINDTFHYRQVVAHALLGTPIAKYNAVTAKKLDSTESLQQLSAHVGRFAAGLEESERHSIARIILTSHTFDEPLDSPEAATSTLEALREQQAAAVESPTHSEFLARRQSAATDAALTRSIAPLVPDGEPTDGIKGFARKHWMKFRGNKPMTLAPSTRLSGIDKVLADYLDGLSEGDLGDLASTGNGIKIASGEDRADGEVTYSIVQRVVKQGDKMHDRDVVDQARAHLTKLHVKLSGMSHGVHVNHLTVRNRAITKAVFLERDLEPGVVQGMEVRMDLSNHASGAFAVKYLGRLPEAEARDNAGLKAKVWAATDDAATLFFVFAPNASPFGDVLHSILVLDKKRTKKEKGKLGAAEQAQVEAAAQHLAKLLTDASSTETMRAQARDAFAALSSKQLPGVSVSNVASSLLAHVLLAHLWPSIPEASRNSERMTSLVCLPQSTVLVSRAATTSAFAVALGKYMNEQLGPVAAQPELHHSFIAAAGVALAALRRVAAQETATTLSRLMHASDASSTGAFVHASDRARGLWEEGGSLLSLYAPLGLGI